jgi:hypothetical protein
MKSFVKYSILITFMLLFFSEVYSQAITWRKSFRTYGNPEWTRVNDVEQTNDGNYITVGSGLAFPMYAYGVSAFGDSIWFKEHSFSAGKILKADGDNFIIITYSGGVAKINSSGDVLWTKSSPVSNLIAYSGRYINDEIYICGERSPNPYQPYIMKLDSSGDLIFYKEYKFDDYGTIWDFAVCDDYMMIYGTGHTAQPFITFSFFIKTDLEGNLIWLKNYISSSLMFGAGRNSMIKVPFEESFIFGGRGVVNNNTSAALMKIDSSANVIWRRNYDQGGDTIGYINNLLSDINGGIISLGVGIGDSLVWTPAVTRLIKFDYDGNELWRKRFGVHDESLGPEGFRQTYDSGFVIVTRPSGTDYPIQIIKTDKFGNAPPPVSVNNNFQILPTDFKLYQNYPNPFNPSTTIKFELNKAAKIEISIYDIKGKLLTTIADSKYEAGIHTLIYEPEGLSSGIYFYNLKSDESIITKKLIYLK